MFGLKTVTVVIYKQTDAIWGIFSNDKKAQKALASWNWKDHLEDFVLLTFSVDYRLSTKPVRYMSDEYR